MLTIIVTTLLITLTSKPPLIYVYGLGLIFDIEYFSNILTPRISLPPKGNLPTHGMTLDPLLKKIFETFTESSGRRYHFYEQVQGINTTQDFKKNNPWTRTEELLNIIRNDLPSKTHSFLTDVLKMIDLPQLKFIDVLNYFVTSIHPIDTFSRLVQSTAYELITSNKTLIHSIYFIGRQLRESDQVKLGHILEEIVQSPTSEYDLQQVFVNILEAARLHQMVEVTTWELFDRITAAITNSRTRKFYSVMKQVMHDLSMELGSTYINVLLETITRLIETESLEQGPILIEILKSPDPQTDIEGTVRELSVLQESLEHQMSSEFVLLEVMEATFFTEKQTLEEGLRKMSQSASTLYTELRRTIPMFFHRKTVHKRTLWQAQDIWTGNFTTMINESVLEYERLVRADQYFAVPMDIYQLTERLLFANREKQIWASQRIDENRVIEYFQFEELPSLLAKVLKLVRNEDNPDVQAVVENCIVYMLREPQQHIENLLKCLTDQVNVHGVTLPYIGETFYRIINQSYSETVISLEKHLEKFPFHPSDLQAIIEGIDLGLENSGRTELISMTADLKRRLVNLNITKYSDLVEVFQELAEENDKMSTSFVDEIKYNLKGYLGPQELIIEMFIENIAKLMHAKKDKDYFQLLNTMIISGVDPDEPVTGQIIRMIGNIVDNDKGHPLHEYYEGLSESLGNAMIDLESFVNINIPTVGRSFNLTTTQFMKKFTSYLSDSVVQHDSLQSIFKAILNVIRLHEPYECRHVWCLGDIFHHVDGSGTDITEEWEIIYDALQYVDLNLLMDKLEEIAYKTQITGTHLLQSMLYLPNTTPGTDLQEHDYYLRLFQESRKIQTAMIFIEVMLYDTLPGRINSTNVPSEVLRLPDVVEYFIWIQEVVSEQPIVNILQQIIIEVLTTNDISLEGVHNIIVRTSEVLNFDARQFVSSIYNTIKQHHWKNKQRWIKAVHWPSSEPGLPSAVHILSQCITHAEMKGDSLLFLYLKAVKDRFDKHTISDDDALVDSFILEGIIHGMSVKDVTTMIDALTKDNTYSKLYQLFVNAIKRTVTSKEVMIFMNGLIVLQEEGVRKSAKIKEGLLETIKMVDILTNGLLNLYTHINDSWRSGVPMETILNVALTKAANDAHISPADIRKMMITEVMFLGDESIYTVFQILLLLRDVPKAACTNVWCGAYLADDLQLIEILYKHLSILTSTSVKDALDRIGTSRGEIDSKLQRRFLNSISYVEATNDKIDPALLTERMYGDIIDEVLQSFGTDPDKPDFMLPFVLTDLHEYLQETICTLTYAKLPYSVLIESVFAHLVPFENPGIDTMYRFIHELSPVFNTNEYELFTDLIKLHKLRFDKGLLELHDLISWYSTRSSGDQITTIIQEAIDNDSLKSTSIRCLTSLVHIMEPLKDPLSNDIKTVLAFINEHEKEIKSTLRNTKQMKQNSYSQVIGKVIRQLLSLSKQNKQLTISRTLESLHQMLINASADINHIVILRLQQASLVSGVTNFQEVIEVIRQKTFDSIHGIWNEIINTYHIQGYDINTFIASVEMTNDTTLSTLIQGLIDIKFGVKYCNNLICASLRMQDADLYEIFFKTLKLLSKETSSMALVDHLSEVSLQMGFRPNDIFQKTLTVASKEMDITVFYPPGHSDFNTHLATFSKLFTPLINELALPIKYNTLFEVFKLGQTTRWIPSLLIGADKYLTHVEEVCLNVVLDHIFISPKLSRLDDTYKLFKSIFRDNDLSIGDTLLVITSLQEKKVLEEFEQLRKILQWLSPTIPEQTFQLFINYTSTLCSERDCLAKDILRQISELYQSQILSTKLEEMLTDALIVLNIYNTSFTELSKNLYSAEENGDIYQAIEFILDELDKARDVIIEKSVISALTYLNLFVEETRSEDLINDIIDKIHEAVTLTSAGPLITTVIENIHARKHTISSIEELWGNILNEGSQNSGTSLRESQKSIINALQQRGEINLGLLLSTITYLPQSYKCTSIWCSKSPTELLEKLLPRKVELSTAVDENVLLGIVSELSSKHRLPEADMWGKIKDSIVADNVKIYIDGLVSALFQPLSPSTSLAKYMVDVADSQGNTKMGNYLRSLINAFSKTDSNVEDNIQELAGAADEAGGQIILDQLNILEELATRNGSKEILTKIQKLIEQTEAIHFLTANDIVIIMGKLLNTTQKENFNQLIDQIIASVLADNTFDIETLLGRIHDVTNNKETEAVLEKTMQSLRSNPNVEGLLKDLQEIHEFQGIKVLPFLKDLVLGAQTNKDTELQSLLEDILEVAQPITKELFVSDFLGLVEEDLAEIKRTTLLDLESANILNIAPAVQHDFREYLSLLANISDQFSTSEIGNPRPIDKLDEKLDQTIVEFLDEYDEYTEHLLNKVSIIMCNKC